MKRSFIAISVLVVVYLAVIATFAQAPTSNPLLGTWTVNIAKSKYSPADLAPKSGTTTFAAVSGGTKVTNDGVDSQGRKTHQEYTTNFDGKDVACNCTIDGKPSPNQDSVSWRKIDDYTYELVAKLKGQALTTTRIVVARDGKTRTGTVTGKNAQGQIINNTVVQEKK